MSHNYKCARRCSLICSEGCACPMRPPLGLWTVHQKCPSARSSTTIKMEVLADGQKGRASSNELNGVYTDAVSDRSTSPDKRKSKISEGKFETSICTRFRLWIRPYLLEASGGRLRDKNVGAIVFRAGDGTSIAHRTQSFSPLRVLKMQAQAYRIQTRLNPFILVLSMSPSTSPGGWVLM